MVAEVELQRSPTSALFPPEVHSGLTGRCALVHSRRTSASVRGSQCGTTHTPKWATPEALPSALAVPSSPGLAVANPGSESCRKTTTSLATL